MSGPFEYRAEARNLLNYAVFGGGIAAAVAAWIGNVPVLTGVIAVAYLMPMAVRLALNPRRGFRMDADRLDIYAPGEHRVIALPRIDLVRIAAARSGTSCDLTLTSGEALLLPGGHRFSPADLAREFRARGVAVIA
jgi:hypothetical protein